MSVISSCRLVQPPPYTAYLNSLTIRSITSLFSRYCTSPWPAHFTKADRIHIAMNLIRSDPLLVIDVQTHWSVSRQLNHRGLLPNRRNQVVVNNQALVPANQPQYPVEEQSSDPLADYPYHELPSSDDDTLPWHAEPIVVDPSPSGGGVHHICDSSPSNCAEHLRADPPPFPGGHLPNERYSRELHVCYDIVTAAQTFSTLQQPLRLSQT